MPELNFLCQDCPEFISEKWTCRPSGLKVSPTWEQCKEGIEVRIIIGVYKLNDIWNFNGGKLTTQIKDGLAKIEIMDNKYKEMISLKKRIADNAA